MVEGVGYRRPRDGRTRETAPGVPQLCIAQERLPTRCSAATRWPSLLEMMLDQQFPTQCLRDNPVWTASRHQVGWRVGLEARSWSRSSCPRLVSRSLRYPDRRGAEVGKRPSGVCTCLCRSLRPAETGGVEQCERWFGRSPRYCVMSQDIGMARTHDSWVRAIAFLGWVQVALWWVAPSLRDPAPAAAYTPPAVVRCPISSQQAFNSVDHQVLMSVQRPVHLHPGGRGRSIGSSFRTRASAQGGS